MTIAGYTTSAVDLTNCDREPIHIPGSIQPHGLFLAIDPDTRRIVVASDNSARLLGIQAEVLLGTPLGDVLGAELTDQVAERYRTQTVMDPLQATIATGQGAGSLAGQTVEILAHLSDTAAIVEIETVATAADSQAASYRAARSVVARLSGAQSVIELCDTLATQIRTVSGFDRVMVYRFDAQWNGEVVAEDKREDLNPFLGLHYPASDIPAQARALYTTNWIRLIADIEYTPVPLVPDCGPTSAHPLDLSHASLRSVSPIHVEYLHHMGVSASMSVSLVIDGQLWGLVACHHYSGPHRPSQDARSTAEFLAQTASMLIARRQETDERNRAMAAQETIVRLSAALANDSRAPGVVLDEHAADVLALVGATACAIDDGESLHVIGAPLDDERLRRVSTMLARDDGLGTFSDNLAALIPDVASPELAGALRVGLGDQRWMLWVRPEVEREVDWGGDPQNQKLYAVQGDEIRLSPRKSFDKWRQVVRERSTGWERWQVSAAERLADQVARVAARQIRDRISVAESLQRALIQDHTPSVPGLQVAARYLPAAGGQLGGDWWDVLPLPDGRAAFVVGDVAGHGVFAAAAMAQLRLALRAYLLEGHPAAESLLRLDRLVVSIMQGNLTTVLVAVIDPADGAVELTSAGHLPPLHHSAEGARFDTVRPRPPLGVGLDVEARITTATLAPGDTLVLFSDGAVERREITLDQGLDTFAEHAAQLTGSESTDSWLDGLLTLHGRAVDDDTTVLAVHRPA